MKREMSPEEFRLEAADAVLLDVRTPEEYEEGHIPGARNIDMYHPGFVEAIKGLDPTKRYCLYCRSGNRSGRALKLMEQLGFREFGHLSKGILKWDGALE